MADIDDRAAPKGAPAVEGAVVPVAAERLARMQKAVALASEGAFVSAIQLFGTPPRDEFGDVERGFCSFISDLKLALEHSDAALDDLKASKLEVQQKLALIERQRAAIHELSVPIIDVWDHVLTVPLVGLLDTVRAQLLTERLLARIGQSAVAWVILDLTGIDSVDTAIADHLIKLASTVRLMGAECLLTGMGPHVAQTFVALEIGLEGLLPMPNLREALKYCLVRLPAPTARGDARGKPGLR